MGNVKWLALISCRARRACWPGRYAARHTLGRAADTAALRQRGARAAGSEGWRAPRATASSERPSSPGSAEKRDISAPRRPIPLVVLAFSSLSKDRNHHSLMGIYCRNSLCKYIITDTVFTYTLSFTYFDF